MVHRYTPKEKTKFVALNVSQVNKDMINIYRDELKLSQSDFMTVLLWVYSNTSDEVIQKLIKELEAIDDDRRDTNDDNH